MSVVTPPARTGPSPEDVQATRCAVLVDEWARAGVRRAVVSPGSRSTPLVLALARHEAVDIDVRLDERSAAFFALGAAVAGGRPVVVCTTSGTASAEVHAAVVEADQGRVPLVVCTADRPPELHGVGAPQTIEQRGLYGSSPRFAVDLGVADWASRGSWRAEASRIVAEATGGPFGPGPVHVNLPLREPLLGTVRDAPAARPDGAPWHRVDVAAPGAGDDAARWAGALAGRRGLLLAGSGAGDPAALWALADALGWPFAADPLSGCRARRAGVVGALDAMVRSGAASGPLAPEVVVRFGSPWASRAVGEWCAALGPDVEQVVVDPWWRWPDPGRGAGVLVRADPAAWSRAVTEAVHQAGTGLDPAWRGTWAAAEAAAWGAVEAWCARHRALSEPMLARAVAASVPADGLLVLSSSMPVRDVEWFVAPPTGGRRVVANRGANGIDGVVSTALGAAAAGGAPVTALVGDLAFLHDLTAWVRPADADADCTVVVADNGGGGIFSFLPQAGALCPDEFEGLFGTPQRVDVAEVAAGLGVEVADVTDTDALCTALGARDGRSARVVRVRLPDRAANVVCHDELHDAMGTAIQSSVGALRPWA
ncbi:MAG TPA: 2-succinyl-5-enolpyruvyl-6-hydroxy-3-cyclohexene-1-carboxylic-acid synthase [Acidimicrobiales bacterium]|nr:2-succinyl-5-enolpyruvyl-6-hydroxy-3-cyclohexene-1-carboxylic-acid synthase [Acidimicrobiales bacterium]